VGESERERMFDTCVCNFITYLSFEYNII